MSTRKDWSDWAEIYKNMPLNEIHARIDKLREEILKMEKTVAVLSLQEYNYTEMKNEKIKEYRNLTHERTCIELTLTSMMLDKKVN